MLKQFASALTCLALAATVCAAAPATQPGNHLAGDYVEARTASVFAGACHYCGEVVTTGHDALCAWRIDSGRWNNVELSGVRVMAAVTSSENLGQAQGTRKTELLIDSTASDAQAAAVTEMLKSTDAAALGEIVAVRRGAIAFAHVGKSYAVSADGFGTLKVSGMPDDECCKQPNLVWYQPLFALTHAKVGYTEKAAYAAGRVGDAWQRGDENSAFYGAFSN